MKPDETKEQFIELRAKGLSFDKIAKELGVSKQTLINWSKELSLEVSNIRAIQLEALQEKYYILKEKRIELFGEKLKAINDELSKRDLSDIPTERLLDLLGKYGKLLKEEEVTTVFKKEEKVSMLNDLDLGIRKEVTSWQA